MLRICWKKKTKNNKNHSLVPGINPMLQNAWTQILSKVWTLVRKRQEALNAINSFAQNSKELQRENLKKCSPGSVLKAESEDVTQIPPSDGGCSGMSEYQLHSVWQAQWQSFRPSSTSRCCDSTRSWSRSCLGRVPAFHEGGPSTSLTHLNRHNSTALHFRFTKSINNHRLDPKLTLFDDVDDIVGIEAELIGVLCIIGEQSFTLRYLGFRFRCRFGPSSTGRGPTDRWSVSSDKI